MSIPIQPSSSPPSAVRETKEHAPGVLEKSKAVVAKVQDAMVAINPSATNLRLDAFEGLSSIKKAFEKGGPAAAKLAFAIERARETSRILDPTDKFTLLGKIGLAVTPWSAVSGVVKSVEQFKKADEATREWARTGSDEARNKAIGSVAKLSTTAIGVVLSSAETYVTGKKLLVTYTAGKAAFMAAAPAADPRIAKAAAWAATKHVLETGGRPTLDVLKGLYASASRVGIEGRVIDQALRGASTSSVNRALRGGAVAKASKVGVTIAEAMGASTRAAGRTAFNTAAREAGEATMAAATKAAAGTTARSLARFAPGLNVALAVLDTAQMYSTIRDPKASGGKKIASVVTAIGAWVSATNIPLVSQAGALVSMVSAFTGALL